MSVLHSFGKASEVDVAGDDLVPTVGDSDKGLSEIFGSDACRTE